MYSSAERDFYVRHYGGGLDASDATLEDVRASLFAPGRRYHLIDRVLRGRPPGGRAIEIGCGSGGALQVMVADYGFSEAVGFDIAFDEERRIGPVRLVPANFNQRLPVPDGWAAVVVAMMVIEHVFDPFHAFREVARVLAPGGVAAVNLPLVTSLRNRWRLLTGRVPETSVPFERWFADREWDGNHLHYFSLHSIRRLAAASGLHVGDVTGVGRAARLKSLFPQLLAGEVSFTLRHAGR